MMIRRTLVNKEEEEKRRAFSYIAHSLEGESSYDR
jgi:hypothetical protein